MIPLSTRRQIEGTLPTVAEMLRLKNEVDALRVLTLAEVELDQVGYDNWNGGTEIWTARLRIPVDIFVAIENGVERLAEVINKNISTALGNGTGFWLNVEVGPKILPEPNLDSPDGTISTKTRGGDSG